MSVLRWHRLSALWKNWMFNQEPAEEQDQIPEALGPEAEPQGEKGNAFKDNNSDLESVTESKTQSLGYKKQRSESDSQNVEYNNLNTLPKIQKSELLKRSCSEPCSQVTYAEDRSSSYPQTPESCGGKSRQSFCSEQSVPCILQVDNGSEGDDSFLQREGSQRRSRRRFRRVNPRGERELITDGQDPASYNTVRIKALLTAKANANHPQHLQYWHVASV